MQSEEEKGMIEDAKEITNGVFEFSKKNRNNREKYRSDLDNAPFNKTTKVVAGKDLRFALHIGNLNETL